MFYFSSLLLVNALAFVFVFARINNECYCYHHSPTTNTSTRSRTRTRIITSMTTSTPPTSHPSPISLTTSRRRRRRRSSSSSSSSLAIRGIRNGLHTAAVDADVINKVDDDDSLWDSINALTLFTNDMEASCLFYQKLGLYCTYGGTPDSMFSTFSNNNNNNANNNKTQGTTFHINLELNTYYKKESPGWGRCVFHVNDVDALYEKAMNAGLQPEFEPTDANWGERYFQILDPMGHEISLAKRIEDHPRWN